MLIEWLAMLMHVSPKSCRESLPGMRNTIGIQIILCDRHIILSMCTCNYIFDVPL